MKKASMILAALACVAVTVPTMVTPASAYVTRTITTRHGIFGHGCRTVRTVRGGPLRRSVIVRRVCR